MITIQPTETITIDDKTYAVAEQSDEIRQMVQYLDDWREQEAAEVSALLKTRSALKELQQSLLLQFQVEAQPAEDSGEAVATEDASFVEVE
jgi:hypothetical protein